MKFDGFWANLEFLGGFSLVAVVVTTVLHRQCDKTNQNFQSDNSETTRERKPKTSETTTTTCISRLQAPVTFMALSILHLIFFVLLIYFSFFLLVFHLFFGLTRSFLIFSARFLFSSRLWSFMIAWFSVCFCVWFEMALHKCFLFFSFVSFFAWVFGDFRFVELLLGLYFI